MARVETARSTPALCSTNFFYSFNALARTMAQSQPCTKNFLAGAEQFRIAWLDLIYASSARYSAPKGWVVVRPNKGEFKVLRWH